MRELIKGFGFHFRNINLRAKIGNRIKEIKKIISKSKTMRKITRSAAITKVLINIPSAIAMGTNPFLYSLFHGLK